MACYIFAYGKIPNFVAGCNSTVIKSLAPMEYFFLGPDGLVNTLIICNSLVTIDPVDL